MSVISFLALAAFFSWVIYRLMYRRFFSLARQWPGPKCHPVFGNTLQLLGPSEQIFEKISAHLDDFKDLGRLWIGPRFFAFIFHPADVEIILSSNQYIEKSEEYDFLRPWIGNGLLTSTGDIWKAHRKAIAPSFHLAVLKPYLSKFNEAARSLVSDLEKLVGEPFDVHDHLSSSITKALLETSMGVEVGPSEAKLMKTFGSSVKTLSDITHFRHAKAWLRLDIIFNMSSYAPIQKKLLQEVHDLTFKMMMKKRAQINTGSSSKVDMRSDSSNTKTNEDLPLTTEGFSFGQASGLRDDLDIDSSGGKKKLPFLEALIRKAEIGDTFNFQDVHEQINTILFEGHDTTSATSSFFLCTLASRPDVQKKCFDEIQSIMGDSDRDITLIDINEMKYLERCIMETMRLYPPVPILARHVNEEIKLASHDLTVPIGSTVLVTTYALHRRADIYPNPHEFNPDHFLPEKSAGRHFYSYVPFSAGPRSCVGRKYAMLKMKIMLATVVRHFRIIQVGPAKGWKLQANLILKRQEGYKIGLEVRKRHSPAANKA